MNLEQNQENYLKLEEECGITQDNFKKKYLFTYLRDKVLEDLEKEDCDPVKVMEFIDNSDNTNSYIPLDYQTQSQKDGLNYENEQKLRSLGVSLIQQAAIFLKLPIRTTHTAATLFQRYYFKNSFYKVDFREIAMGSLFLACKVEETSRKPRDIATVFDQVFKISQGLARPVQPLGHGGHKYMKYKDVIAESEREILCELGFEIYQVSEKVFVFKYLYNFLQLFKPAKNQVQKVQAFSNLVQRTYGYLNDSIRTPLCLHFPPNIIVTACIYLALADIQFTQPDYPWWVLFEASLDQIQEASGILLQLYELDQGLVMTDAYIIMKQLYKKRGSNRSFTLEYLDGYQPTQGGVTVGLGGKLEKSAPPAGSSNNKESRKPGVLEERINFLSKRGRSRSGSKRRSRTPKHKKSKKSKKHHKRDNSYDSQDKDRKRKKDKERKKKDRHSRRHDSRSPSPSKKHKRHRDAPSNDRKKENSKDKSKSVQRSSNRLDRKHSRSPVTVTTTSQYNKRNGSKSRERKYSRSPQKDKRSRSRKKSYSKERKSGHKEKEKENGGDKDRNRDGKYRDKYSSKKRSSSPAPIVKKSKFESLDERSNRSPQKMKQIDILSNNQQQQQGFSSALQQQQQDKSFLQGLKLEGTKQSSASNGNDLLNRIKSMTNKKKEDSSSYNLDKDYNNNKDNKDNQYSDDEDISHSELMAMKKKRELLKQKKEQELQQQLQNNNNNNNNNGTDNNNNNNGTDNINKNSLNNLDIEEFL